MRTLPFAEVWGIDFEFQQPDGERPTPVCMVAREFKTGRLLRPWQDELPARPPFDVGPDSLLIAYSAAAELGCFIELGWPQPARVLDLFAEFRARTSGLTGFGSSLFDALTFYGLPHITAAQKAAGRALVMRGGPWSAAERKAILDYCQTDVDPLEQLTERMLPWIRRRRHTLGGALLRGRYTWAVAHMQLQGVPIDTPMLDRIRTHRDAIKRQLIEETDAQYGVYEDGVFKMHRFEAMVRSRGIDWPRTDKGNLSLNHDRVFKPMCDAYPWLHPLRELRDFLSKTKLENLHIGSDGRNRAFLNPFGSKTGRNQPSSAEYIFGPGKWVRHLIKPPEGRAVAYIDWSLQEFCIAAVLSGDRAMQEVLEIGDMYLVFAELAGWAPPGASKATYKEARDRAKPCVLGLNYGMQAQSLASRMGVSVAEANHVRLRFAQRFPTYWEWAESRHDQGVLRGSLETVFGWPIRVAHQEQANTLRNYPMQATGAEMLRLACSLAVERGVEVDAPVHDAVLIEADTCDITDAVAATREVMEEASKVVLDGYAVGTDAEITRWPDHCVDGRGSKMWAKLTPLLPP